jgi:hypothetical protein
MYSSGNTYEIESIFLNHPVQLILLMVSTGVLETCRELEYLYTKKTVRQVVAFPVCRRHVHEPRTILGPSGL